MNPIFFHKDLLYKIQEAGFTYKEAASFLGIPLFDKKGNRYFITLDKSLSKKISNKIF